MTVALALIMAGALGNCYDRLVFGHVRDFVHFHVDAIGFDCAIFNFADNMLVAGAVTLVLYAMRPEESRGNGRSRRSDSAMIERETSRRRVASSHSIELLHDRSDVVVERELVGMGADRGGPRPRGSACTRSRCR